MDGNAKDDNRIRSWADVSCQTVERLPDDPANPGSVRYRVSGIGSLADFDERLRRSALARLDKPSDDGVSGD